MSNLDQEIADALAKVERLRKKKGVAGEKERSRFAEAIMSPRRDRGHRLGERSRSGRSSPSDDRRAEREA